MTLSNISPTTSITSPDRVAFLEALNKGMARLVRAVQDLSQARDVETIQEIVRHAARELTGADGATFVLRDGDKCHYVDEDSISPLWKGLRFPISICISGWAMTNGRSTVIPDIYVDPRIPVEAYRPTFVKSLVMVPIRQDAPLGAIGNYWATRHEAPPEEVALLQALADTTAVAMENVKVYNELEQRVEDRTQELEAANRELEAFSYSVSHDLRAPLRHIRGFSELLEEESGLVLNEAAREHLEGILGASNRMERLIDDLLAFSRLSRQTLRRSPVDLNAVVDKVVGHLAPDLAGRSLRWVRGPLPTVQGDEALLTAAFENLLSNAVKFTSRRPEAVIEVGTEERPTEVEIFVKDNGAGFEPAYAHRLFRVFQRLHTYDEFKGTGIGLANVQRIIQRHGGRVWAEGRPGEGATFHVALPQEEAEPCP
ncbi:ATP-binding protein [Geothrix sp. 21YS21S-4]|uniref:sensor histidine kinase n=1 Tax=Geothrix sp. 21YS21S-4 TaxID=3068889 RepID=UPI0027B89BC4|nr:ATP-binding protein [Geothrix sp. 21YS21S-4]